MSSPLIQVGIRATRKPNGDFEKATPIYMKKTKRLKEREAAVLLDVENAIIPLIRDYIKKHEDNKKQREWD